MKLIRQWLARRDARRLIAAGKSAAAVAAMQRAYGPSAPVQLQHMHDMDNWLADRRGAERELFLTHTPGAFTVGADRHGYVITRIKCTTPTALAAGGRAACYCVMGRKVHNDKVSRETPGKEQR